MAVAIFPSNFGASESSELGQGVLPLRRGRPVFYPGGLGVLAPKPIVLDASLREEHELRFAKTTHPIESGAQVTDHLMELPRALTMDVVMTTHTDTLLPNTQATRHKRLHQRLIDLARARTPFDVVTSLGVYTGMVFTSIRTPRTLETSNALIVTCTLEKIEIAIVDVAQNLADVALDGMLAEEDLGAIEAVAGAA